MDQTNLIPCFGRLVLSATVNPVKIMFGPRVRTIASEAATAVAARYKQHQLEGVNTHGRFTAHLAKRSIIRRKAYLHSQLNVALCNEL